MESIATKKNGKEASVKEEIKVAASNPFDALYDGDSGDDVINNAVQKLKQVSVGSEPDNAKKAAKKGKNSLKGKEEDKSDVKANNRNIRGENSNYSGQNRANGQRGYDQRGASYYYNNRNHNGNNGHQNGNNTHQNGNNTHQNGNNTHQNGLYLGSSGKFSSRSSNGTEDGASVKSDREQREEEFQQKLKEFKYDPQAEEKKRNFLATYRETLEAKEAAIGKAKLLKEAKEKEKNGKLDEVTRAELQNAINNAIKDKEKHLQGKDEAWEIIRLSEAKKMTLDEYEKMKEESKKASQVSKEDTRVVKSSDFDGMVVVAKRNSEDNLSLKPVHKPEAKPKMKADKTQQKKKGLDIMMGIFSPQYTNDGRSQRQGYKFSGQDDRPQYRAGSQRQGYNFSEQEDRPRYRAASQRQVQSVQQNDDVSSLNLKSGENFPDLHSASGA